MNNWIEQFINRYKPCEAATEWLVENDFPTPQAAWEANPDINWALWVFYRVATGREMAALSLAFIDQTPLHDGRFVIDLVTDPRSLAAIDAARRFVDDGTPIEKEVVDAAAAASAARADARAEGETLARALFSAVARALFHADARAHAQAHAVLAVYGVARTALDAAASADEYAGGAANGIAINASNAAARAAAYAYADPSGAGKYYDLRIALRRAQLDIVKTMFPHIGDRLLAAAPVPEGYSE
jgi:hypothetical protein